MSIKIDFLNKLIFEYFFLILIYISHILHSFSCKKYFNLKNYKNHTFC